MNRVRLTRKIAASDKPKKPGEGRDLGGFEYDKTKAKVLKKALHNINVSLGTLISAMKDISMIRGSEITPDGKLGGKGFIMSFKEIKQTLNEAIGKLSDVTDTLADELTNPMWGLSPTEKKVVKKEQKLVDNEVSETEEIINKEPTDNPENDVEDAPEGDPSVEVEEEIVPEESLDTKVSPKESAEEESIERYRSLLSSQNDKTAGTLGRKIMANLLTGENKNG